MNYTCLPGQRKTLLPLLGGQFVAPFMPPGQVSLDTFPCYFLLYLYPQKSTLGKVKAQLLQSLSILKRPAIQADSSD